MDETFQIVWLKRDLRIEDHAAFFEARKRGRILALYVIEPDYWQLADTSQRQWHFIAECLEPLSLQLAKLGIPLLYFHGSAKTAFQKLVEKCDISAVHSHQETGNYWTFQRDISIASVLTSHQIPWHEHLQHGVFRKLESRNGWAEYWDKMMLETGPPLPARQVWPEEKIQTLSSEFSLEIIDPKIGVDFCPKRQKGGRDEGVSLLASFLNGRGEHYRKAMSSPLEGADACSRISAHLAYGTLSIRESFQAALNSLRSLDKENPAHANMRKSISSFTSRLHWHCHFIQKLETEPEMEWRELHPAYRGMRSEVNHEFIERWYLGQTGLPFLDACMRSLKETGWLNFRMRAMVMSFASYHLWQPWQETGKFLGTLFTDYEPGIHWSQIQMQSGTTGFNTVRMYNPVKQGYDQDKAGIFIRTWVPELANLSNEEIHEPWKSGKPPNNYPDTLVDYKSAARDARDKIWSVRKGDVFKSEKRKLLKTHASRKPSHHKGRNRKSQKDNADQLTLDL